MDGGQTAWPTSQKKLIKVTLAPQITAAPQEMRTPILPRPERCGLELLEPKPHTIAETIRASTDRMRPTVITAPTMSRSCSMPGRPELLGSMSITAELLWTKTERWFCHQVHPDPPARESAHPRTSPPRVGAAREIG